MAKDYDSLRQQKFVKSALEKQEALQDIMMSRQQLSDCIAYARLVYNAGRYAESVKLVDLLYSLVDDSADILNLGWAKLANSLVLAVKGDAEIGQSVADEFKAIKSRFDAKGASGQAQRVVMSCSLVYYALIAFFYQSLRDAKYDFMFELFLDEKYLAAIQLGSPQLLRYLVLLYMISYEKKSLKVDHRTLVSVLRQEVCEYSDVFTEYVRRLYVNFELSGVREHIDRISQAVKRDALFGAHADLVVENCKKMYFEVYCKIYNSVEIQAVADFLGTTPEAAEVWLVNLIRKNNIKAVVDSSGTRLDIGLTEADEVDALNKRTKELMSRNRIILSNVTKVFDDK